MQDLLHGDLEIQGSYTNPIFFNFKQCNEAVTYSTTAQQGDLHNINTATGTVLSTGMRDPTRMTGGAGIVMYYEGCPTTGPLFQVEYIYHLEGSPTLGSSATTPVASVPAMSCVGTTNIVEAAMASVAGVRGQRWIDKGLSFANNANSIAKKMTGMGAGRLAMSALSLL